MKETINIEIEDHTTMAVDIKATKVSLASAIAALVKKYYEISDDAERYALFALLSDVVKGNI